MSVIKVNMVNPEGLIVKREELDRRVFIVGEDEKARQVLLVKWRTIREGWTVRGSDMVALFPTGMIGEGQPCAVAKDDPGLHAMLAFVIDSCSLPEEAKQAIRDMLAETMR